VFRSYSWVLGANKPTFELEHLLAFLSLSDEPKFSLQFDLRRGTANEDVEVSRVGVPVVVLHAEIRERRSSFTDMRLLSPGFKFTLAKPFSSLAGRGTLECVSPTYTSATSAPSRGPTFRTLKETVRGASRSEETGVTVRPLYWNFSSGQARGLRVGTLTKCKCRNKKDTDAHWVRL